jgi:L-fucose isomerase-like protein
MNPRRSRPITLGLIVSNRDFFPDSLVAEARKEVVPLLEGLGVRVVAVSPEQTKLGGVETFADARRCAELFSKHRDEIDGILVCLPNFGDERGVAETIKLSGLNVPVLIQGYPDDLNRLGVARRRDAFCGKISVCNNLVQAGIPFTLTTKHVVAPSDPTFRADLTRFLAVCRIVRGMRRVRIGAIGARPGAFNTVRYSEKILERNGINVTTADLSEILGRAEKLGSDDPRVVASSDAIRSYANTANVPADRLVKMAKLDAVIADFVESNGLDATAIQCWTSVQQNYGCNVCTSMSRMSENFAPSACEVDVTGTLTMYAMQLAANSPAALVDWNNNYGADEERCVLFHCGNWAKSLLPDVKVSTAPILGTVVGEENTYGALEGRTPAGPLTYGRLTTDDVNGTILASVGEGDLTDDPLDTFGTRAVARVPKLQQLMHYVCKNGFEHHVVMTASHSAAALAEAFTTYLGWPTHVHGEGADS